MSKVSAVSFFGKEIFEDFKLTNESFSFKWTIVPNHGVPGHYHAESDELFDIQQGELTFTLNGKKIVAGAGEKVLVPHSAVHSVFNKSKNPAICHVTYTPASDQDKFMRAAQFLLSQNPKLNGTMGLITRSLFLTKRLGYKDFSTPGSAATRIPTNIFLAIVMFYGNLAGWNKLTPAFKQEMQKPA